MAHKEILPAHPDSDNESTHLLKPTFIKIVYRPSPMMVNILDRPTIAAVATTLANSVPGEARAGVIALALALGCSLNRE